MIFNMAKKIWDYLDNPGCSSGAFATLGVSGLLTALVNHLWPLQSGFWFVLAFLLLLAAVSSGLYMFGMATNDIADHARDRGIHPDRVIPSGRISLRNARLAAFLVVSGSVLAILVIWKRGLPGGDAAVVTVGFSALAVFFGAALAGAVLTPRGSIPARFLASWPLARSLATQHGRLAIRSD